MQYSVDINTAVLPVECMIFEYSIKDEMYYKIKAALQTWYFIQEQGMLSKYRNTRSGKGPSLLLQSAFEYPF